MRLLVLLCALGVAAGAARDRYHQEEPLASASGSRWSDAERTAQFWAQQATDAITERERRRDNRRPARNVVMFLGDGMSVPTLTAARALLGQREEQPGEEAQLSFEAFPSVGLSKTYCVNAQVADSACSATAYLCGVKANSGTIGVTAAVPRYNCDASLQPGVKVESIAAWALRDGRDAGVVTTTRITHASPAGVYANVANRHWESDRDVVGEGHDTERCPDIAHQLIHQFPGNQFKVILGGGRREFLPTNFIDEEGSAGVRTDGRNLIGEWRSHKQSQSLNHSYVWERDQLMELLESPPEYLLGLFESDHLQYHLEANKTTEPTLTELTEIAIKSLSRNEKGFFLFVESGRIDHAHHDNFPHLALDETIQMSSAVARAAELLSEEDSLIVVTADHAHVMSLNGYPARGRDILGPSGNSDTHGVPYMTLSYTNGPGARIQTEGVRPNVLNDQDYRALRWQTHADVPLESETHGGDDVAVFAWGPHHDMFTGLYEQSQLPHLMAYAGCFGPGKTACSAGAAIHVPAVSVLILTVLQLLNLLR